MLWVYCFSEINTKIEALRRGLAGIFIIRIAPLNTKVFYAQTTLEKTGLVGAF